MVLEYPKMFIVGLLVGGLVAMNFIFPEILGFDYHPNWRTPSFFRGVQTNHQPDYSYEFSYAMIGKTIEVLRRSLPRGISDGCRDGSSGGLEAPPASAYEGFGDFLRWRPRDSPWVSLGMDGHSYEHMEILWWENIWSIHIYRWWFWRGTWSFNDGQLYVPSGF